MKTIILDTSIDYTSWDINEVGSIEMTEWQPIDTAPKDGTDVLVWCGGAMFIACMEVGRWFFDRTDYSVKPLPTHWMPLPAPPENE